MEARVEELADNIHLNLQGRKVLYAEASDRAGGRIKTDSHEGFLLDRVFQVLLTAYPETRALLNYTDLKLKKMLPGATVLYNRDHFEIADPFRRPSAALATLFDPVITENKIVFEAKEILLVTTANNFTQKLFPKQN